MHILHVVGARPNFMKAAPVLHALSKRSGVKQTLVHTGQHYDSNMSDVFFSELQIPAPDANLNVGSGSHAQQTAEIMSRFEPIVLKLNPDIVLVYGDVNSTVAAALVSAKLGLRVGHVEAGLRSFDWSMPEEINRVLTDRLAGLLFTPSEDGDSNLMREGVPADKIYRVGNVMIDSLVRLMPAARRCSSCGYPDRYALITLHRPSNVDNPQMFKKIMNILVKLSSELPVVFPVHPRTRARIAESGLSVDSLILTDPLPYIEFLALQMRAAVVITDSGGIQEETTFLGVPCLTVRNNTERPVTIALGTNILVGQEMHTLSGELSKIIAGNGKQGAIPPLWDGQAAERIADVLLGVARIKTQSGDHS
jgi:UDP-N-acetylglucosamine 2-epimerase (non-hydrolysing)